LTPSAAASRTVSVTGHAGYIAIVATGSTGSLRPEGRSLPWSFHYAFPRVRVVPTFVKAAHSTARKSAAGMVVNKKLILQRLTFLERWTKILTILNAPEECGP
jgi:hypothetical protein